MAQTSAELPCNLTSALPGDKVSVDGDDDDDDDDDNVNDDDMIIIMMII